MPNAPALQRNSTPVNPPASSKLSFQPPVSPKILLHQKPQTPRLAASPPSRLPRHLRAPLHPAKPAPRNPSSPPSNSRLRCFEYSNLPSNREGHFERRRLGLYLLLSEPGPKGWSRYSVTFYHQSDRDESDPCLLTNQIPTTSQNIINPWRGDTAVAVASDPARLPQLEGLHPADRGECSSFIIAAR